MQRVLVVDDFERFREFICSKLQEAAFTVISQASDGLEAIQKAEELQPDVILLDVGLPRLNGLEVARRISIVAPQAKILFVSENTDAGIVDSALALSGVYGYVAKSSANQELLTALDAMVNGNKFLSRNLAGAVHSQHRIAHR